MEKCSVTFTNEVEQKIICDFTLHDNGDLEFKPRYEPEVDMRTNLGLAGRLCEIFIMALNPEERSDKNETEN